MVTKRWMGSWPSTCDLCNQILTNYPTFIDGNTLRGHWALMCPPCHALYGTGLGTGKGQKYSSSSLVKLEG